MSGKLAGSRMGYRSLQCINEPAVADKVCVCKSFGNLEGVEKGFFLIGCEHHVMIVQNCKKLFLWDLPGVVEVVVRQLWAQGHVRAPHLGADLLQGALIPGIITVPARRVPVAPVHERGRAHLRDEGPTGPAAPRARPGTSPPASRPFFGCPRPRRRDPGPRSAEHTGASPRAASHTARPWARPRDGAPRILPPL
eukprot:CAMPEP_0194566178 /NCGR_PEP_ID=MMETSP0292-20121207/5167_1 /TAXON_ID=39354 /ORGANISM="Heterosigma akashiwo, Strain CCMP2393" /LENGTH=194 /DNA_ID=CAMNT_0039415715 /DNA_START=360 /DNA_END=944 /DNA_ORIENTATION=-